MRQIAPFLPVCTSGTLGDVTHGLCTEALKTRTPDGFPFPALIASTIATSLHSDGIVTTFVLTGFSVASRLWARWTTKLLHSPYAIAMRDALCISQLHMVHA